MTKPFDPVIRPATAAKPALVCSKCDKTFPLFMQAEFTGHIAACSYEKPLKSSRATEENLTPDIEPKTKGKNSEVAGQPLCHQTMTSRECIGCSIDAAGKCPLDTKPEQLPGRLHDKTCECGKCPEQPNTELLIVKTIQGLTTCINNELEKLVVLRARMLENDGKILIDKALEDIDSFEKTTLFELQKAFE